MSTSRNDPNQNRGKRDIIIPTIPITAIIPGVGNVSIQQNGEGYMSLSEPRPASKEEVTVSTNLVANKMKKQKKVSKSGTPPPSSRSSRTLSTNLQQQQQHQQQDKDIFSFKKHSMDYFTVNGVVLRTGYRDPKYWYILCIKELLDNAVDFLWKHYRGHKDASVTAHIMMNDSLLHIKIRNSNSSKNIPVFQHTELIFDPDMRYGSKQDVGGCSKTNTGFWLCHNSQQR